jgi:hypothetical protein
MLIGIVLLSAGPPFSLQRPGTRLANSLQKAHNSDARFPETRMRHTTEARNQISPLLDRLIRQLDEEGSATQRAFFDRIRRSLDHARYDLELATSIRELSSSTAVGFRFSNDADVLMARILEKAEELARELSAPPQIRH